MGHGQDNTKRKSSQELRTKYDLDKVVGYVGTPQGSSVLGQPERSNPQLVQEDLRRREFWSEAISELQQKKFTTVEEAMKALVDIAVVRLHIADDDETRNFLHDLLLLEPEIEDELRLVLRIG